MFFWYNSQKSCLLLAIQKPQNTGGSLSLCLNLLDLSDVNPFLTETEFRKVDKNLASIAKYQQNINNLFIFIKSQFCDVYL